MTIPRKLVAMLMVSQLACTVVGLIFQGIYLRSMVQHRLDAQANELDRISNGTTSLATVLLPASLLALVWIAGLLSASWYLILSYHQTDSAQRSSQPEYDALKKTQALLRTQETVIFGLAKLADYRDSETGDHLERISYYSSTLAAALQRHPDFCRVITTGFIRQIGISSALHDIGKVGIEDSILCKPDRLTPVERERMKTHSQLGAECLQEIERRLGNNSHFLRMAREIAAAHHEHWDGGGYPNGLAGDQIPLAARIVALADVYDALSSKRVYKQALPHDECVALILQQSGKQFDPRIVEAFSQSTDAFLQISRQMSSPAPSDQIPPALNEVGHNQRGSAIVDASRTRQSIIANISGVQPIESPSFPT